ncbi:PREDICTED: snaclec 3-like, partial [Buceros rhinoceros silvestris]|uniref:snaclec 3-like n=1 Tax=Buceros rhinoceros silvestris TaxID=175836 RepID=UPI0005287FAB
MWEDEKPLCSPLDPPSALLQAGTQGGGEPDDVQKCAAPWQGIGKLRSGTAAFKLSPHTYLGVGTVRFWISQPGTCELCPPGWQLHRGRCYYFSEEAASWKDSQRYCVARKSQLLVIEDETEMEFIDNKEKDTKYIWIGSKIQNMKKQRNSSKDLSVKEN